MAIEVPEGSEKPYSCRAGYFRRLNGTAQKMNHQEIRIMFRENETIPFEERTVRGFSFEDISKGKIRFFIKEADIHLGNVPAADFLRSLKVADESGVKNAGILFFAKDAYNHLHQSQMTLLAFKGTDRLHIYDRGDVRDDLLIQFSEAVAFLKKHLNIRSEIRGFNREDIYEIPLEVLREALVNALMHRDYGITGTQVSVEVYDDRVEIVNPGGLPKGLSARNLGTVSIRRNELIADLFFRLHKVERIGLGFQKMKKSMVAAGLREPTFASDAFFRAIFQRSPGFALKEGGRSSMNRFEEKLGDRLGEKLGKTRSRIVFLMAKNAKITIPELAELIGITTTAIENHIRILKNNGLVKRIGPAKGGYWEVVGIDTGNLD